MEYVVSFLHVLIVFLPGLLWAAADLRWGFDKNPSVYVLFGKSLMFGLVSYWVLVYGLRFFGWLVDMEILIDNPILKLTKETRSATLEYEILGALPNTFVLIGLWLLAVNKDLFTRFWVKIGVVSKHKDRSLSSIVLVNSPKLIQKVRIWDDRNGRTYSGVLVGFLESKELIEVLLKDLTICHIDGETIDKSKQFLYSCKKEDFKIEIISLEARKNARNV